MWYIIGYDPIAVFPGESEEYANLVYNRLNHIAGMASSYRRNVIGRAH
jgi:hypothetical protein